MEEAEGTAPPECQDEYDEEEFEFEFDIGVDGDADGDGADASLDGDAYEYGYGFDGGENALRAVVRAEGGEAYEGLAVSELEGNRERGEPSLKKARLVDDDNEESAYKKFLEELSSFGLQRRRRKRNEPKRRGRKKGSRKNLSPEVDRKLGDATLQYASGEFKEAIATLHDVVRLAPNLPDSFNLLGMIYDELGERNKAFNFLMIAAHLSPKDASLWLKLVGWSREKNDNASVRDFLVKAIRAEPDDELKFELAHLYNKLGEYRKAADLYEQIYRSSQDASSNHFYVGALKMAAVMYKEIGQVDKAINLLEQYVSIHTLEALGGVLSLLISFYIDSNAFCEALEQIERVWLLLGSKDKLPLEIRAKEAICRAHLGDMTVAEGFLNDVQMESSTGKSVSDVANSLFRMGQHQYALKFYIILENVSENDKANLYVKIAECYLAMKETSSALSYFYRALNLMEDDVDLRVTMSSILMEVGKEDESFSLLSCPENADLQSCVTHTRSKQWWLDSKIKMQLATLYLRKGMLKDFATTIFPLVLGTLKAELINRKWRRGRKLSTTILNERTKVLGEQKPDSIFPGPRPIASAVELQKANRAKRSLEKRAAEKEERKAAAMDAGLDWQSDESDGDVPRIEKVEPPIPGFLKVAENHQLLIDLCKALATTSQYSDALQIVNCAIKAGHDVMPNDKMEELRSLGAQIAFGCTDPRHGFRYVRHEIQKHPFSASAWNCYYRVFSRLEERYSSEIKFLNRFRHVKKNCVPPILICGHQFTAISQHQTAAEHYLQAYKIEPENPFINLCVGTALINLSLGFRLQNKHQTIIQGFAFLHQYLRLCDSSQEALYNVARAYHHVGLVTLAVIYYEKVLAMKVDDLPIPHLRYEESSELQDRKPGYCDLRREAAYNLHLIYKKSGATDLARNILRTYCVL